MSDTTSEYSNPQHAMCDISDTRNNLNYTNINNHIQNEFNLCDNAIDDNDTASEITDINSKDQTCVYSDNIYLDDNFYNSTDLAVLMNTKEDHHEAYFENILLPIMNIECNSFIKFIFINKSRNFSCNLIDNVFKNLNFRLSNELLLCYSRKFSIDITKINPILKIKVVKECSFKNLSESVISVVSLNKQELIDSLNSQLSTDKKCIVNVVYKMFSETLKIGLNLVFRFKLENINT